MASDAVSARLGARCAGVSEAVPGRRAAVAVGLAFITATLIWGSTWEVIRTQIAAAPPVWSVSYRFAIGALAMGLFARRRGHPLHMGRRAHLLAATFGIALFAVSYNCTYSAERYVTSGLVAVLFSLMPLFNALIGRAFTSEPIRRRFAAGTAVALCGALLLFVQELGGVPQAQWHTALGILYSVGAVLTASIASVMQTGETIRKRPLPVVLAWAMAYGAAADMLFAATSEGWPTAPASAGYWAGLLYLGIIASAAAFALYFHVIRAVGAAKAAYLNALVPVLAMALSTFFEGYRWSATSIAGAILALTGLAVALGSRASPDLALGASAIGSDQGSTVVARPGGSAD